MSLKSNPYSSLKIFHQYDILKKIEDGHRTAPIYIRIKPTNKCNHNCNYCHYRNPYLNLDEYNYEDYIPKNKMLEIIKDISDIGVKAVTFSGGGEPLVYPYIQETMRKVLDKGIELSIITNGSLLNNENADILAKANWVRISLESAKEETYDRIRSIKKGSFSDLCKNIENFSKIKSENCEFGINFVVGKENFNEVYEAGKLMKELGVNHIKFTAQISNDVEKEHSIFKKDVINQIHNLIDNFQDEKFKIINLYESDFESDAVFGRKYSKCYIKNFVCVIAANSKVYYCHDKAYLSNGQIGDLSNNTFKNIWFSNETTEKFKQFDAKLECKHHCVYDDRNQLLNTFFDLDKNHVNFI